MECADGKHAAVTVCAPTVEGAHGGGGEACGPRAGAYVKKCPMFNFHFFVWYLSYHTTHTTRFQRNSKKRVEDIKKLQIDPWSV